MDSDSLCLSQQSSPRLCLVLFSQMYLVIQYCATVYCRRITMPLVWMLACALCITHRPLPTRSRAFNYKRADWDGLRASLILCPGALLDDMGVNDAVDLFYDLLEAAVSDHVSTVTLSRKYPWFDNQVRGKRAQKKKKRRPLPKNVTQLRKRSCIVPKGTFFQGSGDSQDEHAKSSNHSNISFWNRNTTPFPKLGGVFFFFGWGRTPFLLLWVFSYLAVKPRMMLAR